MERTGATQQDPMRYRVRSEKCRDKMVCITNFSTVRTESKSILHDSDGTSMPSTWFRWNVRYNRLTEASHLSPSVQTRHIYEHVINPERFFKTCSLGCIEYMHPTSMNMMETTRGDPNLKVFKLDTTETSCVFFSQFWIRRRQYDQTQRHVAKIRPTPTRSLDEIWGVFRHFKQHIWIIYQCRWCDANIIGNSTYCWRYPRTSG